MKPKWNLVNGDERAADHPTFKMPPLEVRRHLKVGSLVKLCFETSRSKRLSGERMWVKIVEVKAEIPRRYVGLVNSYPVVVRINRGTVVEFGPEHVIDVEEGW